MKRSFPLISIENVEYDETHDPTSFHLIFSNFTELLQAETVEEAKDWVQKITEGRISIVPTWTSIFCNIVQPYIWLLYQGLVLCAACTKWYPLPEQSRSFDEPFSNEMQMHEGQTKYLVPVKQPEGEDEQPSQVKSHTCTRLVWVNKLT